MKKYFEFLTIPTIVCLGNHDVRSSFYEGWMHETKDIPFLESFDFEKIHWISFDNSLHGYPNGYINTERLSWLENELSINLNCIVLMHHQFENLPVIPGLEHGEQLISVLEKVPPLVILNGHTHCSKTGFLGKIPVFTAPSISFRAVNLKDGNVIFSQAKGYRLYEVDENDVSVLDEMQQQGKELAVWKK